ncbi:tRNA glutamyl-Q(34) synthetase GluQRS [Skermanella sp. TT6]|uniref:tRNA glutamyl-Q(34) synthetase GluQRS n=1 Tax=Skermanella cutis TaxID=2775420 RepID=A0ABX7BB65_9PROT|nr:tRNA glutamyl-Q(34) synthetase GluQRS [Skermanella sp. TT6]QQP91422.1 tRNA glutamyl-Q(34) synthetase GluQRS [Skermanella sp. TT6]
MSIVTRFAPSPTGHLHLGHAHSALFGWHAAVDHGGRFLLRIEDIDPARCRPEFERDLIEDLEWLGLDWPRPVRRQSEHLDDYRAALERLDSLGVTYPCFCTRREIEEEIARAGHAPHGPDGPLYPGTCRALTAGERADRIARRLPFAVRIDVARASDSAGPLTWHDRAAGMVPATPRVLGDAVLARKDVPTSYHLSVTVDDHLQGVTLVTRGKDLFCATHLHRLLQALLGYPTPEYHHHGLLTNERGERLAKRDRAVSLRALRAAGRTPAEVRAMAGFP